ncbi:TIGR03915 family putative DNA repair protein [Serpentinicella alkaliphila]|uniref:Putative DNA metabolism protein n=1 Tax=Serpentinicella alkaliphila TaxID=1734049 RepID=A0A4R2TC99_9FIRM|nr:TIGR03915 family putative DNA repair protein [Serpentinicella alkaliphila]QUH26975.1 TIGR03915 family putative DNA repair protein [Serpentinicella alkaliphila]TCQ00571.1 putative DNA metabolism protein [Serpentinicella alkaliphila]
MIVYVYDGTFEGLLTSIYDSFYRKEIPTRITYMQEEQKDFLTTYINITTDEVKFNKVYNAIKDKISYHSLQNIYYAFLSEQKDCEIAIYNYLRLGFKIGKSIDGYLSNNNVLIINDFSRKVQKERHAMLGLIRFMELDKGLLYAKIQPKYNILSLVSPHFEKRLASENWVIHDENRNKASIYTDGEWYITELKLENEIEISNKEKLFQSLWQNYFHSISIKERKNLKLQQQNMPKRYWVNLIEKNM